MKKLIFLISFLNIFLLINAQTPQKFDLGGSWEFRKAGTEKWNPAKVPGSVHLDLMMNIMIKDPFVRANEDSVQWIAESNWEYRRIFYADESMFSTPKIDLVLEGLDTYANVYLNDSLILVSNNMFRQYYIENVKYILQMGKNELRVQFASVPKINHEIYVTLPFKLPGDEKVVCRKAAYNFGWDWGPKLITSGIWKPVYLRMWNHVNVHDVRFIQKYMNDSVAALSAVFTLTSVFQDTLRFRIDNDSVTLKEFVAPVNKGPNIVRFDFKIKNPRPWWPSGLGEQYRYKLKYFTYLGDVLEDQGMQKVGLRVIKLVQQKDTAGRTFLFVINKYPIFIRGANYIPQDNFPSRVSDSAYRRLLTEVRNSGMNMLRVWGGGIYERDIFYDLCDELGILVWQDFMFACAMYPGDRNFIQNVTAEAVQNVVRLRRHPCIALWCGNNEIEEGWKNWGWVKDYKYSPNDSAAVFSAYRSVFNDVLPNVVRNYDTLRTYIPTSPRLGWGNPNSVFEGDMHYWGVWWGRQPFSAYNEYVGRFMSEYGFQGFPDIRTIGSFTTPDDQKLNSPVMKVHQKHPQGFEIIDEYMKREFRTPKDFVSYNYVSQVLQAEGIKTAIEAHRRAYGYCMGTMFWQLNDCWPVVSWSSIDYYGHPKALQYYIRNEYRDILISPVVEKGRIKVYIISDRYNPAAGNLKIKLMDFDGKVRYDTVFYPAVPYLSSEVYFDVDSAKFLKGADISKVLLTAELYTWDIRGEIYKSKLYFRPVKDLDLQKPAISKEISEIPGGYKITLKSDKLVKNLWLWTNIEGKYSDNFFDMLPGETYEIKFMSKYKGKDAKDVLNRTWIRSMTDSYEPGPGGR